MSCCTRATAMTPASFRFASPTTVFPPRRPHLIERAAGTLLELPLATIGFGSLRIPAAGGGYLRHFPLALTRSALLEHGRRGKPAMFYVHPWEIDPDQPRIAAPWLTR